MSGCDGAEGLLRIPKLISDWKREFVTNWIDEGREKGYGSVPEMKGKMDSLESEYHTQPLSIGHELEKAVLSGDQAKIDTVVTKITGLSSTSDQIEAACEAVKTNERARKNNPHLPQITLEETTDDASNNSRRILSIKYTMQKTRPIVQE